MESVSGFLSSEAWTPSSAGLWKMAGATAVVGMGLYHLLKQPSPTSSAAEARPHEETQQHRFRDQVVDSANHAKEALAKQLHHIEEAAVGLTQQVVAGVHARLPGAAHQPAASFGGTVATQTPAAAMAALAYEASDVIFVYHTGTADEQAELLQSWARAERRNGRGRTPTVKQFDVRAGAGTAVAGTLAACHQAHADVAVTVLASSQSLPTMAAALGIIAQSRFPVAFHVAVQQLNNQLRETLDMAPLMLVKETGFVLLSSLDGQDTLDTAIAAQLLAQRGHQPVLHLYDGVRVGRTMQQLHLPFASTPLSKKGASSTQFPSPLVSWLRNCDLIAHPHAPVSASQQADLVRSALQHATTLTGHQLRPSEYFGSLKAAVVLVVLGPLAPALALAAQEWNSHSTGPAELVGVLAVRALRPWIPEDLCRLLPKTVRRIGVLEAGQSANGGLLLPEVSATLFSPSWAGRTHPVVEFRRILVSAEGLTPQLAQDAFGAIMHRTSKGMSLPAPLASAMALPRATGSLPSQQRIVTLWGRQHVDATVAAAATQAQRHLKLQTAAFLAHDHYTAGGIVAGTLVTSSSGTAPALLSDPGVHHAALLMDVNLLVALAVPILSRLADGATLLIVGPLDVDELTEQLSPRARSLILQRHLRLETIDLSTTTGGGMCPALCDLLLQLVLEKPHKDLPLALAATLTEAGETSVTGAALTQHSAQLHQKLATGRQPVAIPPSWLQDPAVISENDAALRPLRENEEDVPQFVPRARLIPTAPIASGPRHVSRAEVAWRLLYSNAFGTKGGVRPGHHGVYQVKLTRNVRLTPLEYHRNVFHLEMDITGTGLTYEIGDALGVFGHNDKAEVLAFLQAYNVDPSTTISLEHPDEEGRREIMTVARLFTERLDLFGKPSQKFYEAIAPFATDSYQRAKLEWLGTEDKEGFKLRQLEAYTYADVLAEFQSARPPLDELIAMVPPIKPRHYSISSSMKMCPNSVHLLVVLVDWVTPKGRTRYGQCTRYLASLRPEDDVYLTVDIKPSAMHLPPSPKQPIIMAGLGTGMAPFRAFVQEREWQRQQGIEVGPVMLYFGSRHRHEEYLYGEYLDAMHESKLITHLGLAFSRDQEQKIYIQHKIVEDAAHIVNYLRNHQGHFYLCGPTWPVPDVKRAICDGLIAEAGMNQEEADQFLDSLKEDARYVLEVY